MLKIFCRKVPGRLATTDAGRTTEKVSPEPSPCRNYVAMYIRQAQKKTTGVNEIDQVIFDYKKKHPESTAYALPSTTATNVIRAIRPVPNPSTCICCSIHNCSSHNIYMYGRIL